MYAKRPVLCALLVLLTGYAAYPYLTLLQLGQAIRQGDAATLQSLVAWSKVRQGIKEDICDMVVDPPDSSSPPGALPGFGSGFVRGVASSAVDQRVTPEALVAATQPGLPDAPPASGPRGADVHVNWAFFESPTLFSVSLNAPGQTEDIKLQLELRDARWRVTRVWLPMELLRQGNSKT